MFLWSPSRPSVGDVGFTNTFYSVWSKFSPFVVRPERHLQGARLDDVRIETVLGLDYSENHVAVVSVDS